uniref:Clusterin-associated protein 1 n=1 Tax=Clastoptera arizonana TaxID=38151 RepID=A0A1B6C3Q1_9HEMI
MSYRDLRNFTEMTRALNYNRLISLDNFRVSNFPLVAEIVIWLVRRFDPDANIYSEFKTEEDRVILVRSVVQFMAINNYIKLNSKRLYQADGYSVKELLKIIVLLYNPLKYGYNNNICEETSFMNSVDISSKISELKLTRELASQITLKGAILYELLGTEVHQLKYIRKICINNQYELGDLEEGLKEAILQAQYNLSNTQNLIDNIAVTEANLDAKIGKRQVELDRNKKRLQTLQKMRPAFLDEFEKIEVELHCLYQDFLTRFRCVTFLEQLLEDSEMIDQERMEAQQAEMRKILEKIQQEEALKLLDGSINIFHYEEHESNLELEESALNKPTVTRARTSTGPERSRVYGNMTAEDGSLESDSDLLLDDDDNSQLLASDDDLELLDVDVAPPKHSDLSEDDF